MYLGEEVDLEAGGPVALRLPVVQIVPHRKNKLWVRRNILFQHMKPTQAASRSAPHLQDLGQLLAAPQLHRRLVDVIERHLHLLRPLLQRRLEEEAPQAGLILGHRQHLKHRDQFLQRWSN